MGEAVNWNSTTVLSLIATVVIGALVALQPPVNSELGRRTSDLGAAFVSVSITFLLVGAVLLAFGDVGSLSKVREVPASTSPAASIGAAFVAVSLVTVRHLGAGTTIAFLSPPSSSSPPCSTSSACWGSSRSRCRRCGCRYRHLDLRHGAGHGALHASFPAGTPDEERMVARPGALRESGTMDGGARSRRVRPRRAPEHWRRWPWPCSGAAGPSVAQAATATRRGSIQDLLADPDAADSQENGDLRRGRGAVRADHRRTSCSATGGAA